MSTPPVKPTQTKVMSAFHASGTATRPMGMRTSLQPQLVNTSGTIASPIHVASIPVLLFENGSLLSSECQSLGLAVAAKLDQVCFHGLKSRGPDLFDAAGEESVVVPGTGRAAVVEPADT